MNEPKLNKFFTTEEIEVIKADNTFKEFFDEFEAEFKPRKSNKFYEIVVSFPENLEIKKEDLKALYDYLPLHRSEKYLIVDRLFMDLKNSVNPSLTAADISIRIEQIIKAGNLMTLVDFAIVECDWIGELLELFMRSPLAKNMQQIAQQSREECGHEWTFDELLTRVAVGEFQESQRIGKVAQDALSKTPPPIIIIKDEAEIERLRIQYQPKKKP